MAKGKEDFYNELNKSFFPLLRKVGFKGSGNHFRRIRHSIVNTIWIQNNKYGGSCCINLGIHTTSLPIVLASDVPPELKSIKTHDCFLVKRLSPAGKTDNWWKFKGNFLFGNVKKSVEHLSSIYFSQGEEHFNKFKELSDFFLQFPSGSLLSQENSDYQSSNALIATSIAKIAEIAAMDDKKKEYAKIAINQIKPENTIIYSELRKMLG